MGSSANARVRDYLLQELRSLGLDPQVQSTVAITPRFSAIGKVENVMARLKGTNPGRAVLLMAHYDSQPVAPGGGDDGQGVAAILETLRALRAGPALRNDVIALFTDGEEDGLLGASAFMDDHPWAKEIGVALNLEGRGNRGPVVMFETSAENGWLIQQLANSVPNLVATSLSYEVYRRMPNDTDFTALKARGVAGLNFAHLGGWAAYHTPRDTADALDLGTLQHHGAYALALTRHLGSLSLSSSSTRAPDSVYFSVPLVGFIRYGRGWAVPLSLLGLAAFCAVAFIERRARRATSIGLFLGTLAAGATTALTGLLALGLWFGVSELHRRWFGEGDVAKSDLYVLAIALFAVAWHATLHNLLRRKFQFAELALGSAAVWTAFSLASAGFVVGASYVFIFPLLAILLSIPVMSRTEGDSPPDLIAVLGLVAVMIPLVALLAPLNYWLAVIFGVTKFGVQVLGVFLGLSLSLVTPQWELLFRTRRWLTPLVALAGFSAFLVAGLATVRFTSEHPKGTNLFYALDSDKAEALWVGTSETPDAWTTLFLTSMPSREPLPEFFPQFFTDRPNAILLSHHAPSITLAPPAVELLENRRTSQTRLLRLRISPARNGRWLTLYLPDAEVVAAAVDGRDARKDPAARRRPKSGWAFTYVNPPSAGIETTWEVRGAGAVMLRVIEMSAGLPRAASDRVAARPAETVPVQTGDATLVARTFTF